MTAKEIVSSLLEYGVDPEGPRPGSPEDPWRHGGGKPMKFKRGDFEGQRPPGGVAAPAKHGVEVPPLQNRKQVPPKSHLGGLGGRFNWKPPQEL